MTMLLLWCFVDTFHLKNNILMFKFFKVYDLMFSIILIFTFKSSVKLYVIIFVVFYCEMIKDLCIFKAMFNIFG